MAESVVLVSLISDNFDLDVDTVAGAVSVKVFAVDEYCLAFGVSWFSFLL